MNGGSEPRKFQVHTPPANVSLNRPVARRLRIALEDPVLALVFALAGRKGWDSLDSLRGPRRVAKLLDCELSRVVQTLSELYKADENMELLSRRIARGLYGVELLYALTRLIRPFCILETGVAAGVSTTLILLALEANGSGMLHSVDLPNYDIELGRQHQEYYSKPISRIPEGRQPGYLVPSQLKDRWRLHVGRSADVLPRLMTELGEVDLFLHDSEHTYQNMMFEFHTVWPHLREGGFLLSDDIDWNQAFKEFADKVGADPIRLGWSLGGIRKNSVSVAATGRYVSPSSPTKGVEK